MLNKGGNMENKKKCCVCGEHLGHYLMHTDYYSFVSNIPMSDELEGFICHKCTIKNSLVDKLYHISNNADIIDEFIPRIPEYRAEGEDSHINRISLSSSIEGCLTAVPWGNSRIDDIFLGEKEASFLLRVYEFDFAGMDMNSLIAPESLYYSDLVKDASDTDEYWYLKKLKPSKTYLIDISEYYGESENLISCQQMIDYAKGLLYYDEIIEGFFERIESIKYEIIPEERRSKVFRLNHQIQGVNLGDKADIQTDITNLYPLDRTWVDIEERNGSFYIIGEVDTRWTGDTDFSGEIDKEKILDYFNENLSKGKIL